MSLAGAGLTTLGATAFLVYVLLEWFGYVTGPYSGLVGYLLVPAIFTIGLALIPVGMWREGRRRRSGRPAWSWPAIDLGRRRTRQVVLAVAALTVVNLGIVTIASVGVVHYTESNQFCGQVCHTPMTPEFTAHAFSAHSRVECVSCHVGPGAKGMIAAKLNGTRQLYLVAVGRFSRPIPEPLERLPGAVDTCANCHTPGRPGGDLTRTIVTYADDEKNTESITTLVMHMSANHWHARPDVRVEYAASDPKRETVPYIRVTDGAGKVTEYFAEGATTPPASSMRRMDCLDCHNRPAHTFSASADRAVDALIATGGASRALPFVRREMIAALKKADADPAAADAAVASHLETFYRTADARLTPEVRRAVTATQQLHRRNVFPDMKVTWGTYVTQLGHSDVPGCFRCHDDNHKARDGRVVRQDCETCHSIK